MSRLAAALVIPALALTGVLVPAPALAATAGSTVTPAALLAELKVVTPSTVTYDRDLFAEGIDADGDGCRTRQEVLIAESLVPATVTGTCTVTAGRWLSSYDGAVVTDPTLLEMDHVVALKETWVSGAYAWTSAQRSDYANDLSIDATLRMVTSGTNQAKSDSDPAKWVPTNAAARCEYAIDWIEVKTRWRLSVDAAEKTALQGLLTTYCGSTTMIAPAVRTDLPTPTTTPTATVTPKPTTPAPKPTTPAPAPGGGVTPLAAGVHRLAGADRYATAAAIASRFKPGVPVVYVASGANYPDALSASGVAGVQDSPLLLVTKSAIPSSIWTQVTRLKPKQIIIAGGTGVVSSAVQKKLATVAPVTRISGADRYATSRALATSGPARSGTSFVATGRDFPDALSASAAAAKQGGPVVLVDGKRGSVDAATRDALKAVKTTRVRIAGGTGAVSSGIESSLKSSFTVNRHSGTDRYSTAVAINKAVFPTASTVYLAVGSGYADALAGGALAGATDSPLFLVEKSCVPKVVRDQVLALDPKTIVLLGGTGVISNAVGSLNVCTTPAKPAPKPTPAPTTPSRPADVDCGDFSTWASAQAWFDRYYPYYGDIARLDADGDHRACESLPGAP
ncbi:putative cell wall-binding protein [Agromyces terreus]|uniref:Cell wall-binding protein n=1 Tax=Agromyces terreus TaxID=424795 RepID=A0A9X2GXG9_9MICO|nr:cell wall-binding repeat-containing protein [Agromyces terreus]MCP2370875.1 putative cell wall-binding protein [Agromyces terreus]